MLMLITIVVAAQMVIPWEIEHNMYFKQQAIKENYRKSMLF